MPSLGPAEILVILVVALLVFGPDKMPEIAKQVGKGFREFRRVQQHLKSELRDVVSEFDSPMSSPSVEQQARHGTTFHDLNILYPGRGAKSKSRPASLTDELIALQNGWRPERCGDPGKTRTSDTQFRKLLLYPPELRGHNSAMWQISRYLYEVPASSGARRSSVNRELGRSADARINHYQPTGKGAPSAMPLPVQIPGD